jgi:sporulation protein YlmC with PRC-barrel domain
MERNSDMSETTEYEIGAQAYCQDGECGELARVVIDPIKRAITHLVVERPNGREIGRLVPVDLVETATEKELRLSCTREKFEALEEAEETKFISAPSGQWGYGQNQMLLMPFFGMGMGGMGMGGMGMGMGGMGMGPQAVIHDKVPLGEVQVHRGDKVHASDGVIGSVQGLVIEPHDHHVTHVLLQEGHLWGRKQVAIPIKSVTTVEDGIQVSLTKREVGELPPVDLDSTA